MPPFLLTPVIIAGPTASGKSGLALSLAQKYRGEIICADSRQFYAGMSIGTACPSAQELSLVPHHGYESLDPLREKYDAGSFIDFAKRTIADVQARGKRPILVGGTGLYLRTLRYGLLDVPKTDAKITSALEARGDSEGMDKLFAELSSIDPDTAKIIKANDRYRIIRALEIYALTGEKPSTLRQSFKDSAPALKAHWIYKKLDRTKLVQRIKDRVSVMFATGLVEEALRLRERLPQDHWALSVMGYQEALLYSDKKLSRADAEEKTFIRHRQYAKRQFTWFNKESFYRFVIS